MTTLQLSPRPRTSARSPKAPHRDEVSQPVAVSATRVREMLREIAFVLHATRVVRRMDEGAAAEQE